jgi:nicotinate-nucleotide adenylyltransferase
MLDSRLGTLYVLHMRIALMGGTFDPPHLGHTIPVQNAASEFSLDQVWFIPAYVPPHKQGDAITNPFHRAALVALALQNDPRFLLSPVELEQGTVCYTVDTIRSFKRKLSEMDSLFFIMGSDSFLELEAWHDYPDLLRLCQLIIINRGIPEEELKDILRRLQYVLQEDLSRTVLFAKAPFLPISSTQIRTALLQDKNVSSWLAPEVEKYIRKHSLYQRR